mmetsp:Transcript_24436/g.55762  ORF Transcript_24436/g.55762 Transcript_24436/m.55762 type:complete len:203 (-) Transcript_24436:512-1120(-)
MAALIVAAIVDCEGGEGTTAVKEAAEETGATAGAKLAEGNEWRAVSSEGTRRREEANLCRNVSESTLGGGTWEELSFSCGGRESRGNPPIISPPFSPTFPVFTKCVPFKMLITPGTNFPLANSSAVTFAALRVVFFPSTLPGYPVASLTVAMRRRAETLAAEAVEAATSAAAAAASAGLRGSLVALLAAAIVGLEGGGTEAG